MKHGCLRGFKGSRILMKDSDTFLSFSEFEERYDVKTNYLTFYGMLSAIKVLRKNNIASIRNNTNIKYESFYTTFTKTSIPNRLACKELIGSKKKKNLVPLKLTSQ